MTPGPPVGTARRSRRDLLRTAVGACGLGALAARAAGASTREYQLKAAILLNFVKFVEWPPERLPASAGSIVVGVLGKNPFGTALETIEGKQVKGKTLRVREVASLQQAQEVHVLFISPSEQDRFGQLLSGLRNGVLTVSETKGFTRSGGIINLIVRSDRVGFEINPAAAERARLGLSAQLIRLAARVERG